MELRTENQAAHGADRGAQRSNASEMGDAPAAAHAERRCGSPRPAAHGLRGDRKQWRCPASNRTSGQPVLMATAAAEVLRGGRFWGVFSRKV